MWVPLSSYIDVHEINQIQQDQLDILNRLIEKTCIEEVTEDNIHVYMELINSLFFLESEIKTLRQRLTSKILHHNYSSLRHRIKNYTTLKALTR
jgi:predicted transcriptional regulator